MQRNENFYGNSVADSIQELYEQYIYTQTIIQELEHQINNFEFEYSAEEQNYLDNLIGTTSPRPSFQSNMKFKNLKNQLMDKKDYLRSILSKSIDFSYPCDHTFIKDDNDLICVSCDYSIKEYDEMIRGFICICAESSGHVVDGAAMNDYDFIKSLVEQCYGKVGYEVECDMFHLENTEELMLYYNQQLRAKKRQDVVKVLHKVVQKK